MITDHYLIGCWGLSFCSATYYFRLNALLTRKILPAITVLLATLQIFRSSTMFFKKNGKNCFCTSVVVFIYLKIILLKTRSSEFHKNQDMKIWRLCPWLRLSVFRVHCSRTKTNLNTWAYLLRCCSDTTNKEYIHNKNWACLDEG